MLLLAVLLALVVTAATSLALVDVALEVLVWAHAWAARSEVEVDSLSWCGDSHGGDGAESSEELEDEHCDGNVWYWIC